ncbi:hypothetical protein [Taibaiella sp. KBW10]|uniref:hypothetical protein n=1 Tax=Taibaiella sp. KBW10 TaxID=2153357 RepID=UPI001315AB14|nr:hypothetical protein [Taibaiella sp. KBW10]
MKRNLKIQTREKQILNLLEGLSVIDAIYLLERLKGKIKEVCIIKSPFKIPNL